MIVLFFETMDSIWSFKRITTARWNINNLWQTDGQNSAINMRWARQPRPQGIMAHGFLPSRWSYYKNVQISFNRLHFIKCYYVTIKLQLWSDVWTDLCFTTSKVKAFRHSTINWIYQTWHQPHWTWTCFSRRKKTRTGILPRTADPPFYIVQKAWLASRAMMVHP